MVDFCDKLRASLSRDERSIENESDYFASAVLVPLVKSKGKLGILFEVRSAALAWQPGDICFPGGRIDLDDADDLAAALRETEEELGIPRASVQMLGPLNKVVSPIGVILNPFVGFLPDIDAILPNPAEVEKVFVAPLDYLLAVEPMIAHMELATRPLGDFHLELMPPSYARDWKRRTTYPVYFYQWDGHVIWGLTARVLYGFLNYCRAII